MNVCDALLNVLSDYEVEYIFGVPGDAINELIESVRKQKKIRFIHVMHEEAGAFAASAQAKLTGKLAVCVGTAGPGAIHLLNGLYDAKMDHAPVLAITGQVETSMIGTSYQQEVNLQGLFQDVSVYNQTIYNPEQMPEVAVLAIQTALTRRGVAHISIPTNISNLKVPDYKKKKQVIHNNSLIRPCHEDLQKAASLINSSVRPCILAGIGAREAVDELIFLAEKIKAPIIKSLRGKDLLDDDHAYVLGGTGMLGTEASVKATRNCDLFFVIGSDFPYADFYPGENVTTIQLDRETQQIGRRHPVDMALIGDAKITLHELLPLIEQKENSAFLKECQENAAKNKEKENRKEHSLEKPIHPQALASSVSEYAGSDAIITCDTGAVTVWGARNFRIKKGQRFTLSGGLASMAFAMPAAIGAKLIYKQKQVIALCGDGGFAMLMCDFATAVKYQLDIKVFIFNNGKLGLIQMEEEAHAGNPEYETDLHNPDYAKFAEICGGKGITVHEPFELVPAIKEALASSQPCIVNVFINPEELTMPPEITKTEAINYVKAKVTEFFIREKS
jgi:pyruvate oxidase